MILFTSGRGSFFPCQRQPRGNTATSLERRRLSLRNTALLGQVEPAACANLLVNERQGEGATGVLHGSSSARHIAAPARLLQLLPPAAFGSC